MIFQVRKEDNMLSVINHKANLIYADCIYESLDFGWVDRYWNLLAPNSVFIVQTDYHTVAQMKLHLDSMPNAKFLNWVIYKQEWGGVPRKGFPQKHDDILIYVNGDDFYWDKEPIQIPKATAGTKFDKKGTGLKTPCSVFDDLGNFSTMAKERIKNGDGKNIRWQKPEKLLRRLMTPFLQEGDMVIDPFMGTGTSGAIALELGCQYIGIEYEQEPYQLAFERLIYPTWDAEAKRLAKDFDKESVSYTQEELDYYYGDDFTELINKN